jgi:hypothetical protein
MALRAGPTAAAISGSLGAKGSMPTAIWAISTTFGSSILPRTNGRGWAEAARSRTRMVASPECTARWERLPPETSPEAVPALRAGPTAAAISGSLGAIGYDANGNSGYLNDLWEFNPSTNEWAWMGGSSTVPAVAACPECTARWERLPPETSPEAAISSIARRAGPIAAASLALWGLRLRCQRHYGYLNDLWEFNPSTNEWAWMGSLRGSPFAPRSLSR